jgi:V8-like Glu-specific endopeptidase
MLPSAASYVRDLKAAIDTFDRPAVARIGDELVAAVSNRGLTLTAKEAAGALAALRQKRHFALAESLGAALLRAGSEEPRVWRQYAQALIERKNLTGALAVLTQLARKTPEGDAENAEARGLIGRAYKQYYVDSSGDAPHRQQSLVEATLAYKTVFDAAPDRLWHGINAVALACRAAEDRVRLPVTVDTAALSAGIVKAVEKKGDQADAWDCATAMEACVALNRWPDATRWADRYLGHEQIDAFEIASTLRQLTELWRIDPTSDEGGPIVLLLQSHLIRKEGGEVSFTPEEAAPRRLQAQRGLLEAQLGSEQMIPLKQLMKGIDRSRSVAMITRPGGSGFGTGFVVSASELWGGSADELFVLTNAHVVSDDAKAAELCDTPPLRSGEARVEFEQSGPSDKTYRVDEIVWSSLPDALDGTLLRLTPALKKRDACPLNLTEDRIEESYRRVYVIGHPGGRSLTFSLADNLVLGFQSPKLHYRAPTEGGSSGSPVFTEDWDVLALHHAGGEEMPRLTGAGTYPANEGIWIDAIRRALARGRSGAKKSAGKRRK